MIPDPDSYRIIARLFPQLLGVIYLLAFTPFLFQARGLLGEGACRPLLVSAVAKTRSKIEWEQTVR